MYGGEGGLATTSSSSSSMCCRSGQCAWLGWLKVHTPLASLMLRGRQNILCNVCNCRQQATCRPCNGCHHGQRSGVASQCRASILRGTGRVQEPACACQQACIGMHACACPGIQAATAAPVNHGSHIHCLDPDQRDHPAPTQQQAACSPAMPRSLAAACRHTTGAEQGAVCRCRSISSVGGALEVKITRGK